MSEFERFQMNNKQGYAPGLWLTLHIDLGKQSQETLEKILGVMNAWISTVDLQQGNQETWPSDEQWQEILPNWFIDTFKGHSIEEILASKWLWDYSSWIDSMRNRVWEWWGYQQYDSMLTIQLQLDSWPYSISALEYLIRVAGGQLVDVEK